MLYNQYALHCILLIIYLLHLVFIHTYIYIYIHICREREREMLLHGGEAALPVTTSCYITTLVYEIIIYTIQGIALH